MRTKATALVGLRVWTVENCIGNNGREFLKVTLGRDRTVTPAATITIDVDGVFDVDGALLDLSDVPDGPNLP